jgi:hypothetical protein
VYNCTFRRCNFLVQWSAKLFWDSKFNYQKTDHKTYIHILALFTSLSSLSRIHQLRPHSHLFISQSSKIKWKYYQNQRQWVAVDLVCFCSAPHHKIYKMYCIVVGNISRITKINIIIILSNIYRWTENIIFWMYR